MPSSFFDLIWPERPDAYLSTWLKRTKATRFFPTSALDEAERYMSAMSETDDVYFGVGLFATLPAKGRGASKDVAFLPAFHMDFDIAPVGGNVHAKSKLPRSIEEVRGFLADEGVPAPTVLVNSGNGLHAYWPFDRILDLREADARSKAATDLKAFQRVIITLAKRSREWDFDNTADLARVLRWPGTLNHKSNPPKRVEMINV
jgi:hypothetical protein